MIGGDVRSVYLGSEEKKHDWIHMQKEVEVGAEFSVLSAFYSYGSYNNNLTKESRTHTLSFKPFDFFSFRMGKFLPNFGIMWPDHTVYTRSYLGLGQDNEVYGNEYVLKSRYGEVFYTQILKSKTFSSNGTKIYNDDDHGDMVRLSAFPVKGLTLGVNEAWMTSKIMYGGFLEVSYFGAFCSYELDFLKPKVGEEVILSYGKLSYDMWRGIEIFYDNNFSMSRGIPNRVNGLGLSLFPAPHFELTAKVFKEETYGSYFMVHFYL